MKKIIVTYPYGSNHGFGDFLRACLGLTQWAETKNVSVEYYLKDHPIEKYYPNSHLTQPHKIIKADNNDEKLLETFLESEEPILSLNTQWNPYTSYSNETLEKVRSLLIPSPELKEKVENFLKALRGGNNIGTGGYRVVHIRLDDAQFIRPSGHASTIREHIKKYPFDGPTVILSNNLELKQELAHSEGWFLYECMPVHLGSTEYYAEDVIDTCVEIEILKHASQIINFSVYNWPSNFSHRIAELYDIPFTYVPIQHELIEYYLSLGASFHYHNNFKEE